KNGLQEGDRLSDLFLFPVFSPPLFTTPYYSRLLCFRRKGMFNLWRTRIIQPAFRMMPFAEFKGSRHFFYTNIHGKFTARSEWTAFRRSKQIRRGTFDWNQLLFLRPFHIRNRIQ